MVRAPAGRFRIGQNGVATPLHHVTLDEFMIGTTEITREQYRQVMGRDPSVSGDSDNCPVNGVSWFDAVRFCNKLSEISGLDPCYDIESWKCIFTANGFRLPTEAEWEYACRAESYTNFFPGCDETDLTRVGWHKQNENTGSCKPVGLKNQNSWGIYDSHGNVAEWCNDWYGDYPAANQSNPTGPSYASLKVVRGGSWASEAFMCRSAFRDALPPGSANKLTGFRVVCRGK
jgi:formylglycine-generating enzyme required for sulfatase activity